LERRARYTAPIPPRPNSVKISYPENRRELLGECGQLSKGVRQVPGDSIVCEFAQEVLNCTHFRLCELVQRSLSVRVFFIHCGRRPQLNERNGDPLADYPGYSGHSQHNSLLVCRTQRSAESSQSPS